MEVRVVLAVLVALVDLRLHDHLARFLQADCRAVAFLAACLVAFPVAWDLREFRVVARVHLEDWDAVTVVAQVAALTVVLVVVKQKADWWLLLEEW